MKVVILAGGLGTRLSEETTVRPKPMVEIGGRPILWHILKHYSHYGFNDFIICCGYKGYQIKEFFFNYRYHSSDIRVNLAANTVDILSSSTEPWNIQLIDTGDHTTTGGRLLRIRDYLIPDEDFFLTYGDGVSNVDLCALSNFHDSHGRLATVTTVTPPGRFGTLTLDQTLVTSFKEKPINDAYHVSAGFFKLKPQALDFINELDQPWEFTPLQCLAEAGQLHSFKHSGFWQPMDTLRDKHLLESLWNSGEAPWKVW